MNHIKNIEIRNFKSIRSQPINDCRRVNVFIGYPNVGKSNILEAIGLLTFIRQKRSPILTNLVRFERFTQIFNYLRISEPALISFNDKYTFEINYVDESELFLMLYKSNPYDYPSSVGLHASREMINSPSFDGIDDFSGKFADLADFQIKPYKYFSKEKFNKSFSALELKVPIGENMFEVISNSSELTKQFSDILKPYNLSLIIDQSTSDIKINLKKEGDVFYSIPTSTIADTLIRLIFFKTAILSNKNSILLFEEPEAHMFPPYISKFTSDIIHDENNNQFFLATHSPFVMSDLISNVEKDELAIYIISYENETGETLIHRMNEEDIDDAYQFGYDFFMNINNFIPQKQHD